ncbi:hypothetical protein TNCT_293801 [Trichonephila clavata]|uniref:Uncharacterized protein n=1 Tax=Trichonephila clavata TaxID=2740835 RepID=A0A8X6EYD4_TRICU|nr:hypothetical protein TNCT_293801 [Trichonephila clavata]
MTFYSGDLPFGCLLKRNGNDNNKKVEEEEEISWIPKSHSADDRHGKASTKREILLSSLTEKCPSIRQLKEWLTSQNCSLVTCFWCDLYKQNLLRVSFVMHTVILTHCEQIYSNSLTSNLGCFSQDSK